MVPGLITTNTTASRRSNITLYNNKTLLCIIKCLYVLIFHTFETSNISDCTNSDFLSVCSGNRNCSSLVIECLELTVEDCKKYSKKPGPGKKGKSGDDNDWIFQCKTGGECIEEERYCDDDIDCEDKSDEKGANSKCGNP